MRFTLSSKRLGGGIFGSLAVFAALVAAERGAATIAAPTWAVADVAAAELGCLRGHREDEITLIACDASCAPIPWQLDERGPDGRWALENGPEPTADEPRGVVDDEDAVLFMAADAGRRMRPGERPPGATCMPALRVVGAGFDGWAYAAVVPPPAPRSPIRYVTYDPASDVVSGTRIALGFGAPTPRFMALRDAAGGLGPNLLDRLKVRASARFFGVIPLGRDEDDIEWVFEAWKVGPIRAIRRERQWVRLGWRLRTPIFQSETLVYRDAIELPVRLRLNFPPTYFFSAIEVQAVLDFRDLRGWRLVAPGAPASLVGAGPAWPERRADWLALEGPEVTVILRLRLGDTLSSLRTDVLWRENEGGEGPEAVAGERPAVGFRLTEWGEVEAGHHGFAAVAYALPAGTDLQRFAEQQGAVFEVTVEPEPGAP